LGSGLSFIPLFLVVDIWNCLETDCLGEVLIFVGLGERIEFLSIFAQYPLLRVGVIIYAEEEHIGIET